MNYIVERYFLLLGRKCFLFTIRFRLWIIRSIVGCASWYMNAVTMTAASVFFWTMGRNVCVQSISYSLLCKWFRSAVLPLDKPLETGLLFREELKRCAVCGQPFHPGSNRAKYCKPCATKVHRRQKTDNDRKRPLSCGQLEAKKYWICCCFKLLSMNMMDKSPVLLKNLFLTVRRRLFT